MKAKTFTNIDFKEGRQSARGLPAFYCIENSDEGGVLTKTTR